MEEDLKIQARIRRRERSITVTEAKISATEAELHRLQNQRASAIKRNDADRKVLQDRILNAVPNDDGKRDLLALLLVGARARSAFERADRGKTISFEELLSIGSEAENVLRPGLKAALSLRSEMSGGSSGQ